MTQGPPVQAEDCYTIVGRNEDTGDVTAVVVPRHAGNESPHQMALRHMGERSDHGEFEIVAVLHGRCELLVTSQSLWLFAQYLLAQDSRS